MITAASPSVLTWCQALCFTASPQSPRPHPAHEELSAERLHITCFESLKLAAELGFEASLSDSNPSSRISTGRAVGTKEKGSQHRRSLRRSTARPYTQTREVSERKSSLGQQVEEGLPNAWQAPFWGDSLPGARGHS